MTNEPNTAIIEKNKFSTASQFQLSQFCREVGIIACTVVSTLHSFDDAKICHDDEKYENDYMIKST